MRNPDSRSIIVNHWSGKYPLRLSLVACGVAVVVFARALAFIILPVQHWFWNYADPYYVALIGLSVYYALLAPIFVFWLGGSLRSSVVLYRSGRSILSIFSMVCICIIGYGIASLYWGKALSEFRDVISAIDGDLEWGSGSVLVSSDKTQLFLKGAITRALAVKFGDAVRKNPSVSLVHLEGSGGRLDAAMDIGKLIHRKMLDTRVDTKCASACSMLFLTGRKRIVGLNAQLGFHAPSVGSSDSNLMLSEWVEMGLFFGVSKTFIDKAYSVPNGSIWYPSLSELRSANAITDAKKTN